VWLFVTMTAGWSLSLPLRDLLGYPDRLSVLPNLETDAAAYDAFAAELASRHDLRVLPEKHPPGWMLVLGAVYAVLGHSFVAGKLVSWVALVITVLVAAALARRLFGPTAALIAALLVASSPGLRAYVGTLQYEVLTAALFLIFLMLIVRAADGGGSRTLRRAVLAGIVGGALVVTRETFVLVVPIAALWLWMRVRATAGSRAWHAAVVVVAIAALPALAWSAFQSLEKGRLILIADKTREVFDAGHNPRANGTYNEPLVGIGEPAGFAYIREHPTRSLVLTGRKVLYSFGVLRDGWNVPHAPSTWIWRATAGTVPLHAIEPIVRGGWLLVACALAVWLLGASGLRQWWLLPAAAGAILVVHALTLASFRFTVPLLPVLYVLASGPLAAAMQRARPVLKQPGYAAALGLVLVVAVAMQWQAWPLRVTYAAADLEGISAANALDAVSGRIARVALETPGERPVALLPDQHLPRGDVRLTTRLRLLAATTAATPVARVVFAPLAGEPCVADIVAASLTVDAFHDQTLLCAIEQDGPATIAVFSRGTAGVAVDSVRLSWSRSAVR
jgi:4-amino-4-deoxy-L-arabinose transferase-like glycosyltransferase